MKYLKTYENMNLSKNIYDLVQDNIQKTKSTFGFIPHNKQKIIDEYENKIRDCFLYLSDTFTLKILNLSYYTNDGRRYYFRISFNIDPTEEDIELSIDLLKSSLDRASFELGAKLLTISAPGTYGYKIDLDNMSSVLKSCISNNKKFPELDNRKINIEIEIE